MITETFHLEQLVKGPTRNAMQEEINSLNRDDILSSDDLGYGCKTFTHKINSIRERFKMRFQIKSKNENHLPCLKIC